MKGKIFTECLALVKSKFGLEIVLRIIDECRRYTDGFYPSVGTYDHKVLFKIVGKLSKIKGIPVPESLALYGEYCFHALSNDYPRSMDKSNLFGFSDAVKNYIHPEYLKHYPRAELPFFKAKIIHEIINHPVGLILNSFIFSNFIGKEFYRKSKYNIAK
jgi:hypothetical protein